MKSCPPPAQGGPPGFSTKRLFCLCLTMWFAATSISATRLELVEGNPASPVKVVIYEDLASSDCARLRAMLDEKLLPKYGKRVAFVHRDFPLPRHEWARAAALAGRWVYEQSSALGVVFRLELLAQQDHITAASLPNWLREFARRNKLNEEGITLAPSDPRLIAQVDSDRQGGTARGVASVPSVYLGTQVFIGNIQVEDLTRAIDVALER